MHAHTPSYYARVRGVHERPLEPDWASNQNNPVEEELSEFQKGSEVSLLREDDKHLSLKPRQAEVVAEWHADTRFHLGVWMVCACQCERDSQRKLIPHGVDMSR